MHSKKIVGPRIEPWGTPALTGYSCQDFPSTATQSHLLWLIGGAEFSQRHTKIRSQN